MSTSKESFIIYQEYADYIADLTGDEVKALFTAIFLYREGKEIPELFGMVKAYFKVIRNNLDRDEQKYAERCEKNQRSAQKRWGTNVSEGIPTHANAFEGTQPHANDADNDPDPVTDNDPVPENDISPTSTHYSPAQFAYSPNEFSGAWETLRGKWNGYPALPAFSRLFLNLFPDEREKFLTMLSAHGVDDLCTAIENYAPVAADPAKYDTEAKYLYKSLPNFLKAADKYMVAPAPNIADKVEDFSRYNALMQREG